MEYALGLVMTTDPPALVVDWRTVSFVALVGVDVLLEAAGECRSKGSVLRLIPGDAGRRVLDLVGWDDVEEITDPFAIPSEVEAALVNVLSMN
ncbi:MAG: STAS domain-containing protein [Actinomycetota bacterium]|nr:STAS domain-containing protein [Actinomycetota bacterium]